MAVRDLLWWRDAQRDVLALAVGAGLSSSCEAWGLPVPKATVQACYMIDPALEWQVLLPDQVLENQAWLGYSTQLRKNLGTALFGEVDGATLAQQVIEHVLLQISATLRGLVCIPNQLTPTGEFSPTLPTPCIPPAAHAQAWSGAVQLVFSDAWRGMVLHLGPQLMQAWMATHMQELVNESAQTTARHQAQCTSILDAIDSIAVPLHISLADIELDLGSLQSLTLGSVVRLTHALEQPLDVCMTDGSTVCTGYLGRSALRRAIGLLGTSTLSNSKE